MPKIIDERTFDGAGNLIGRLGLDELISQVRSILTGFNLQIGEGKKNNADDIRGVINQRFNEAGGWLQVKNGGVDWVKRQAVGERPRYLCVGVRVELCGMSDPIAPGMSHLRTQLLQRELDLAVLIVLSEGSSRLISDRVPISRPATRHAKAACFGEMRLVLITIEHNAPADKVQKSCQLKSNHSRVSKVRPIPR